jgi:hypothetical protein
MTRSVLLSAGLFLTAPTVAQQLEGNPPSISIIRWEVTRFDEIGFATQIVVFDREAGVGTPASIAAFDHLEADQVTVRADVTDPDWIAEITIDPMTGQVQNSNEDVFLRIRVCSNGPCPFNADDDAQQGLPPISPPSAPPVGVSPEGFFPEDEGFKPIPGPVTPYHYFHTFRTFELPEFIGVNQRRLRGEIDWDVVYVLELCAANDKEDRETWGCLQQPFFVLENPILRPANPQAIADAGADKTVVVNVPTVLDASRTFDAFNDGFNVNDPNVFEKDQIVFSWERLSGPAAVTITQSSPNDPIAEVTLTVPGEYVFRVIVDDNTSPALPTSDTVVLTAVESLPDENPPVPLAAHPASAVSVGATITLDASQSYDPDGAEATAALTYRWKQTNALGDPLSVEDLLTAFQPLSGVDEKVSTWQALSSGTFYFQLLVSDGIFVVPTDLFSVQVVDQQTAGRTETAVTGSSGSGSAQSDVSAGIPSLCGAGLTSLAAVPLALLLVRLRRP